MKLYGLVLKSSLLVSLELILFWALQMVLVLKKVEKINSFGVE